MRLQSFLSFTLVSTVAIANALPFVEGRSEVVAVRGEAIEVARGTELEVVVVREPQPRPPDWRREPEPQPGPPDWRREPEAQPGAPDWRRQPEAQPGPPDWRREPEAQPGPPDWRRGPGPQPGPPDWRRETDNV